MESTSPKPFVFVLMPFHEDFRDIYELGIKQACVDAGAYCERVDEQIFHENILERVYNQMAKADVIVADMTGRNPNVFYEVGYAHALNKKVILLTQNADDIPFDLKHYSHIVYGGKITNLIAQLEPRVKYFADNRQSKIPPVDFSLDFYLNDTLVRDNPIIPCECDYNEGYEDGLWVFNPSLHIHNVSEKVISSRFYKIAIIAPKDYFPLGSIFVDSVNLPDKTLLSILKSPGNIFPGEWKRLSLGFSLPLTSYSPVNVPVILRVLKETGSIDFPLLFQVGTTPMLPVDEEDAIIKKSSTYIDDSDIPF